MRSEGAAGSSGKESVAIIQQELMPASTTLNQASETSSWRLEDDVRDLLAAADVRSSGAGLLKSMERSSLDLLLKSAKANAEAAMRSITAQHEQDNDTVSPSSSSGKSLDSSISTSWAYSPSPSSATIDLDENSEIERISNQIKMRLRGIV